MNASSLYRSLALLAALLLSTFHAEAHSLSASFLSIGSDDASPAIEGQWQIAVADLQALMDLDADVSGTVTAGELLQARERIGAVVLARLDVTRGGEKCTLTVPDLLVDERSDGFYAVLPLAGTCPARGHLAIEYQLMFDIDRSHRAVAWITDAGAREVYVFTPDSRRWASATLWQAFRSFVQQGTHHIWIGYDHIAFLVLLLLPAALRVRSGSWDGSTNLREMALRTLAIVSAFTVAHSITLSLAALGVVLPPEKPIEVAIAASVMLAGLANLVPRLAAHSVWIAFGFGLVHGFGFANVLQEVGVKAGALAVSLAGFNVGVELGQLTIVVLLLPLLYRARAAAFYRYRFVPAASLAIALVALGWLLERAS